MLDPSTLITLSPAMLLATLFLAPVSAAPPVELEKLEGKTILLFTPHPDDDTFCCAGLLFLAAQAWVVQGYQVYGSCMEPNLRTGERLLGSKVGLVEGIRRGDVVVFRPPHRANTSFIKRVVGLPGDLLEIRHSQVYLNGRRLNEPYLRFAWHDDRAPERVGPGMLFVMGDNRDNSNDSRSWGEVPVGNLQAKAWLRYWPLDKVEWIR